MQPAGKSSLRMTPPKDDKPASKLEFHNHNITGEIAICPVASQPKYFDVFGHREPSSL